MRVYGCNISYYTGKVEAYLRYRSLKYELLPTVGNEQRLKQGIGVVQMPVVELADGRWMTDSTPILEWLDAEQPGFSIYPQRPLLHFVALLIEDYADEWLWRSAMHYRWSYRPDRRYAAEALYNDLIAGVRPIPRFLALRLLTRRQLGGFVRGDGVNAKTRPHVDSTYLIALDLLQTIFEKRPFLLGADPTIADFGMMAPMFRHFSQDPTPAEIMRNRAPAVYEWVARMWNAKPSSGATQLIDELDDPLHQLMAEICATHLAQLRQNAEAFSRGLTRYDQKIQGHSYQNVPMSRYRVWCLEQLRRGWLVLGDSEQAELRAVLSSPEAAILWNEQRFEPSEYDADQQAPFNRAINVFGNGVPR